MTHTHGTQYYGTVKSLVTTDLHVVTVQLTPPSSLLLWLCKVPLHSSRDSVT